MGVPVNIIRRNVRTSFTIRAMALFGFLLNRVEERCSGERNKDAYIMCPSSQTIRSGPGARRYFPEG